MCVCERERERGREGGRDAERLLNMGVEVLPRGTDSVHLPHTTTSHHLTPGASGCCTVARETRKRKCTKATSFPKLLAMPSWGAGIEEKERCIPSGSEWGVENASTQPAPLPPQTPVQLVLESH